MLILIEINQDGEITDITTTGSNIDKYYNFIMVDVVYNEEPKAILTERY